MNEENQALRILSELIGYFWHNQIFQLNVNFKHVKSSYEIDVSGFSENSPDDLDEFKNSLQESIKPEMSDYYDQLLGLDGGDNDSYHLLGAIIDQAVITYERKILRVQIIKKH